MKNKKLIISICSIFIVILIGIGTWMYFGSRPKNIFMSYVNNNADKFYEVLNKNNDISNFIKKIDNLSVKSTNDIKLDMVDEKIEGSADINLLANLKNNKIKSDIKLSLDNKELINLSGILANNKVYMKLKDFSKYYYLDEELPINEIITLSENSTDSYKKLINYFKDTLNEVITDNDFNKSNEKIKINDEEINTTKYTIKLDNNLMKKLLENYINKIKNDDTLMNELSNNLNINKEELNKQLDELLNNTNVDNNIEFSYYTKSINEVVLSEILVDNISVKISDYNDNIVISTNYDNENVIINIKKNNNNYDINIKYNNENYLYGTITIEDNNYKYDLILEFDESSKLKIKGDLNIDLSNDILNIDSNINVTYSLLIYKIELDLNSKVEIKEGNEIDLSEIDNASSINNISKKDEKVLERLFNNFEMFETQDQKSI